MGTISFRKADGPLNPDIPVCRRIVLVDERNIGRGIVCPRLPIKAAFLNSSTALVPDSDAESNICTPTHANTACE